MNSCNLLAKLLHQYTITHPSLQLWNTVQHSFVSLHSSACRVESNSAFKSTSEFTDELAIFVRLFALLFQVPSSSLASGFDSWLNVQFPRWSFGNYSRHHLERIDIDPVKPPPMSCKDMMTVLFHTYRTFFRQAFWRANRSHWSARSLVCASWRIDYITLHRQFYCRNKNHCCIFCTFLGAFWRRYKWALTTWNSSCVVFGEFVQLKLIFLKFLFQSGIFNSRWASCMHLSHTKDISWNRSFLPVVTLG